MGLDLQAIGLAHRVVYLAVFVFFAFW